MKNNKTLLKLENSKITNINSITGGYKYKYQDTWKGGSQTSNDCHTSTQVETDSEASLEGYSVGTWLDDGTSITIPKQPRTHA